jgi:hypothetical protein
MKRSTILCASVAAAFVLTSHGAFAAISYNSSKSNTGNIFTYLCKVDLDGPKLCSNAGGTVKAGDGKTCTCFVPAKASPTSGPSKSN